MGRAFGGGGAAYPLLMAADDIYPWAPSVEDIARVAPAYTRGGFDDDEEEAGAPQGTFTENTDPTRAEVEDMILTACDEVAGRVGMTIPSRCWVLAKTTAKWHVAAAIANDKQPAGTDDASGEYRGKILNFRNSLDALVYLARIPSATRLQ